MTSPRFAAMATSLLLSCTAPRIVPGAAGDGTGLERVCMHDDCEPCARAQDCADDEVCEKHVCVPAPRCGDGVVNGAEECDDGNQVGTDRCYNCMHPRCGDGQIQAARNAECEVGYAGWTTATCHALTCMRRLYGRCTNRASCLDENPHRCEYERTALPISCPNYSTCQQGVCAPVKLDGRSCPEIPTHVANADARDSCWLLCDAWSRCPPGLVCAEDGRCIGSHDEPASR